MAIVLLSVLILVASLPLHSSFCIDKIKTQSSSASYRTQNRSSCSSGSALASTSMKGSVYTAVTVDGYIATKNGGVDFLSDYQPDDGDDLGFAKFMATVDVMIMGRKTFEKVLSFGADMWPYGDTKVMVWSRSKVEIPAHLSKLVSPSFKSPSDLFDQLEAEGFQNAYIDGGFTVQSFLREGLVDQLELTRVPLILGDGIPLFDKEAGEIKLIHLRTTAHEKTGMVTSVYGVKK